MISAGVMNVALHDSMALITLIIRNKLSEIKRDANKKHSESALFEVCCDGILFILYQPQTTTNHRPQTTNYKPQTTDTLFTCLIQHRCDREVPRALHTMDTDFQPDVTLQLGLDRRSAV